MNVFEAVRLRDRWFDEEGFLRAQEPHKAETRRPRRKWAFGAFVAASLIGVSSVTIAAEPIGQANTLWPTSPTEFARRHALLESLKSIRRLKADWNGHVAAAPVERSVSVAEYVVPQVMVFGKDISAGVNGDGNVFFKFCSDDKVALLTVEPRQMHLVYMEPGRENIYLDDEAFNGKVLPTGIKRILDEHLKSS